MRRRILLLPMLLSAAAAPALGVPYWVSYEGNDYPENEGWERSFSDENGVGQGGSERSLDGGVLTLDSMRDPQISDNYRVSRQINPDPGELFVAEWRLRVLDAVGPLRDVGVTIARDGMGTVSFRYGLDHVQGVEEDWTYDLEPLEFHAFRVESPDMVNYSLWIDGMFVRDGMWHLQSLNESYFFFGDAVRGAGVLSNSQWDYVRFGVVPEPGSPWILATGWILFARRNLR